MMTLDDVMQKVTDYADARLDYSETGTDKIYETSFNIARFAIHRYVAEQVATEREACAELCDAEWNGDSDTLEYTNACNDLAEAIRARAQEE